MDPWRLIKLETADAFSNMAIDEAIMKARIEEKIPNTLRFYQWEPSAVSIGRFQVLDDQIYRNNCKKCSVDIVRRISGGGSVFHDSKGEITYSVVVKLSDLGFKDLDLLSAYQKICSGINEAVTILGTKSEYRPPDPKRCPNLIISGKKISGNSQVSKKGVLLQHGTFMIDLNHEKMFTFLKVPWAKTLEDVIKVSKKKLTCAKQELSFDFSDNDAYFALVEGFKKALKIQLVESYLTDYEVNLVKKLKKERFLTEEWNFFGKSSI
jgi:lipoate-protein ligase A